MEYTFTVFTPTFNRAASIHRVYESLQSQTFRDFEWLIVDDGSEDDTADLVRRWIKEADFSNYVYEAESCRKARCMEPCVAKGQGWMVRYCRQ